MIAAYAQESSVEAPAVRATQGAAVASAPTSAPSEYKPQRLREMAAIWKGTVLEPYTVKLLSMLMQEDGTVTAERRHDCHGATCYAVGIQGHNICQRGTPLIYVAEGQPKLKFCSWKKGKSPMQQFEEAYPTFAFDWREQFREYTYRMEGCINDGTSVNQCIRGWNWNEGTVRIARVDSHAPEVQAALADNK